MDKDFFVLLIRLLLMGMVVIGVIVLFAVVMAAGVIDNIFHAVKKSRDSGMDEKSQKNGIVLNIISAAVLTIP